MVFTRTLRGALVGLSLLAALTACQRDTEMSAEAKAAQARAEAAFLQDQQAWRKQRVEALTQPDGWTSLIGLHWLDNGVRRVGSGRDNGIQLMQGPAHLGLFTVKKDRVSFTADTALTLDGQPARGGVLRSDADPMGASVIAFDEGKGLAVVIKRGGRLALRVRHADAESRLRFTGLNYWPGGRDWQMPARFIAHPPGTTLPIVNIIGVTDNVPNPGKVEFQRDGKLYHLEALDEGGATLLLVFADRTSGHGSYGAGRFLDVPKPDTKGHLRIDFNQAYNPPCAFTPFATCPLPPPENRLDLRVEAGEKDYIKPTKES
ncbi:MAG: DUF1684 domain-containing protein [Thermomonas sp.]|uniref:DUF1684 domain-containing protein n=1 Tax=Thermomonas sp. TaxID=1971895 RepID=UPI001EBF3CD5|nr:DUF1684 domain-containing protein [Thermomonas sp.]MBV2209778.1 DUF1684 domain-containing protein [Thermomonas sp.]